MYEKGFDTFILDIVIDCKTEIYPNEIKKWMVFFNFDYKLRYKCPYYDLVFPKPKHETINK